MERYSTVKMFLAIKSSASLLQPWHQITAFILKKFIRCSDTFGSAFTYFKMSHFSFVMARETYNEHTYMHHLELYMCVCVCVCLCVCTIWTIFGLCIYTCNYILAHKHTHTNSHTHVYVCVFMYLIYLQSNIDICVCV